MKKLIITLSLFIILSVGLGALSYLLAVNIQNKSNTTDELEKQSHVTYKKKVSMEKLNQQIIEAFLNEMLSTDYKILLPLFKEQPTMSRKELVDAGDTIKNHKTVIKAYIDNKIKDNYEVVLLFSDNTNKKLVLTIQNGKITTPISKLEEK